ncbi:MAG TPA: metalloregulator ArsR/SmtB family transcription factor [Mycobacteriales bacterium]|nr:metalloregulator ArsR/SmtB family transcription factor [Mycobacteriales bacterium]
MTAYGSVLDALGHPTRRTLFERLSQGPVSVEALADGLPISRPAVSQHLKVLKDAGLVTVRPQGTRRLYSVDPRGVAAVRAYFDRFWDTALAAFQDAVESPDHPLNHETQEQP